MARQNIELGTPPTGVGGDTPRSANIKINTMFTELYAAITGTTFAANVRAVTLAGIVFTSSAAVVATDTVLAAIGKLQAQLSLKAGSGANNDITSLSAMTTALSVAQGGTGGKTPTEARSGLQLGTSAVLDATTSTTDTTVGRVARLGDHGFGVQVSPFIPDMNAPVANGYSWVTSGTANPITGFASGSQVLTFFASATEIAQMVFSRTTPMRIAVRRMTTGSWQAHADLVTTAGAILDPALGTGGIMSTAVVSGFRVDKYINGSMCVTGKVSLASQGANTFAYQTLTLPVTFFSVANMTPGLTCNANATSDIYGVIFQRAASTTSILYAVRNGGTAQTFEINVTVWGTWK